MSERIVLLLIPTLLGFCLLFPSAAWAYIDPGFGGYVIHSINALIVSCFAVVSAVIIYFFRIAIGKKLRSFWMKYRKGLLVIAFCALIGGALFFSSSFYRIFFKPPMKADLGAHVLNPNLMDEGYRLFEDGLIDAKGTVIKKWSNRYLGVIDTNGDYYGCCDGRKWGRYTWDDKPVWEKHFVIHHELYLSPQGTVFTFTRQTYDYNNYKVDFDIILEFDKDGNELQRYSFRDHVKEFQPYKKNFNIDVDFFLRRLLVDSLRSLKKFNKLFHLNSDFSIPSQAYDYFHINSFSLIPPNPLEGQDPAFRPGNWLISILHGSMVFILDQDTKKILWHAVGNDVEGGLQGQHSASMLPDGNILLFENGVDRKASRILIFDPVTLKIKWQYADKDFFSMQGGFVQKLPNGNFLITESDKNHAFELTPDKKIVWHYYGPFHEDETIYRVSHYPKEMIEGFLKK